MSMKREIWKGDGWIIETSGGDLVTQDDPSQLESVVGTEKKVFVGDLGRVCVIAIKSPSRLKVIHPVKLP